MRQEIGERDRSDPEDIHLFHHSEVLRELIKKNEKPSDISILSTEGQIIEVGDDELLKHVFGDVEIINVDFETQAYSQIDVKCIGTNRKFLIDLNLIEVEADNTECIDFGSSIAVMVSDKNC